MPALPHKDRRIVRAAGRRHRSGRVRGTGRRPRRDVRTADGRTCQLPKATDDDTISILGRICDHRDDAARRPSPASTITVEDEAGKVVGEATTDDDGTFDIPLPGTAIDNLGKTYTVKIDEDTLPEGTSLADPKQTEREVQINLDNDFIVDLPDRRAGRQRDRQGHPGAAAARRRHRVLAAAGDGGARPVDDLRHHRADQLRPRRADHLRRDRRPRASTSCPATIQIGGANITVIVAVIVGVRRLRRVRLAQRRGPVAPAAPARHRPDRDDDRQHRPVDLPAQHLPVLRRRATATTRSTPPSTPYEIGPLLITPKEIVVVVIGTG